MTDYDDYEAPDAPKEEDRAGDEIPLFPDWNKAPSKRAQGLEIYKTDPPNDGYKGLMPVSTTREDIAKQFGNGIYHIHAVNENGKVLRRLSNQKIAITGAFSPLGQPNAMPVRSVPLPTSDTAESLKIYSRQHEKDAERLENFGKMTADTISKQSEAMLQRVTTMERERSERDRDFFGGIMAQQQQFMAAMMQAQEARHEQTMERLRAENQHSLEMTRAMFERERLASDPNQSLALLERGMNLALALSDGQAEDSNPIVASMNAAVEGIREIGGMVKLSKMAPIMTAAQQAKVRPNPRAANSASPSAKPQKIPFTRKEIEGLTMLKKVCEANGMDFSAMVEQAGAAYAQTGPLEPEEEADDSLTDESGAPSEESEDSDVAHPKPQ